MSPKRKSDKRKAKEQRETRQHDDRQRGTDATRSHPPVEPQAQLILVIDLNCRRAKAEVVKLHSTGQCQPCSQERSDVMRNEEKHKSEVVRDDEDQRESRHASPFAFTATSSTAPLLPPITLPSRRTPRSLPGRNAQGHSAKHQQDEIPSPSDILHSIDKVLTQTCARLGKTTMNEIRAITLTHDIDLLPPFLLETPRKASAFSQMDPHRSLEEHFSLPSLDISSATSDSYAKRSTTSTRQHLSSASTSACYPSSLSDLDFGQLCKLLVHKHIEQTQRGYPRTLSADEKPASPCLMMPITFIRSAFSGKALRPNYLDASCTGMCDVRNARWLETHEASPYLDAIVAFNEAIATPALVGQWLIKRFGLSPTCVVTESLPTCMAALLSFPMQNDDVAIEFGHSDKMFVPCSTFLKDSRHGILPNATMHVSPCSASVSSSLPTWRRSEKQSKEGPLQWIVRVRQPDAGRVRTIIRDVYTKTWHAFVQVSVAGAVENGSEDIPGVLRGEAKLVNAVSFGGSVGLDNKLYLFFIASGPLKGIRRYEHGTRVAEFSDLRANARCILESQALQMRRAYAEIRMADDADDEGSRRHTAKKDQYYGAAHSLNFAPFDQRLRPSRCWTWGPPSLNPSISQVFCHVIGGAFMVSKTSPALPTTDGEAKVEGIDEKSLSTLSESSNHATSIQAPSRPVMGATYVAAYYISWVDHATKHSQPSLSYSEFLNDLMRSRKCTSTDVQQSSLTPTQDDYTPNASQDLTPKIRNRMPLQTKATGSTSIRSSHTSPTSRVRRHTSSGDTVQRSSSSPLGLVASTPPSEMLAMDEHLKEHVELSLNISNAVPRWQPEDQQNREAFGMERSCSADRDLWTFYGAMLEEHVRLHDMILGTTER